MVETDITKGFKSEKDSEKTIKEEIAQAEVIIKKDQAISEKTDTRNLTLMILGLIVIFGVIFGGFFWYNNTLGAPKTIDELHQMNIDGELEEDEGFFYNGVSFIHYDNLWWAYASLGTKEVIQPFYYKPTEVENITIEGDLDTEKFNKGKEIYISTDPTEIDQYYSLAAISVSHSVAAGIERLPVGVWSKEYDEFSNRSIITCETANGRPVIEFVREETAGVELEGTCIKVIGTDKESLRSAERLLYRWYRIMP